MKARKITQMINWPEDLEVPAFPVGDTLESSNNIIILKLGTKFKIHELCQPLKPNKEKIEILPDFFLFDNLLEFERMAKIASKNDGEVGIRFDLENGFVHSSDIICGEIGKSIVKITSNENTIGILHSHPTEGFIPPQDLHSMQNGNIVFMITYCVPTNCYAIVLRPKNRPVYLLSQTLLIYYMIGMKKYIREYYSELFEKIKAIRKGKNCELVFFALVVPKILKNLGYIYKETSNSINLRDILLDSLLLGGYIMKKIKKNPLVKKIDIKKKHRRKVKIITDFEHPDFWRQFEWLTDEDIDAFIEQNSDGDLTKDQLADIKKQYGLKEYFGY